ncbi:MAG: hypothetical protein IKX74_00940 [Erysipelotrichaceae bacterium]|nr:hypothetical protein [Erysipelotrichaceae bacterium]
MRKVRIAVLTALLAAGCYASVLMGRQAAEETASGNDRCLAADSGLKNSGFTAFQKNLQPLPSEPLLKMPQYRDLAEARGEKPAADQQEGCWQDVHRLVRYYWLNSTDGSYRIFADYRQWCLAVQQLEINGIECVSGSDWRSEKIGRIFIAGSSGEDR